MSKLCAFNDQARYNLFRGSITVFKSVVTVRLPGSSVDLFGTLSKDGTDYLLVQADGKQVVFKQFDYMSVLVNHLSSHFQKPCIFC